MSFFDSEVVRAEMAEISELQEEIYNSVFSFPTMGQEEKVLHVKLLDRLLKKQQILYTRLSLSNDPDAIKMKTQMLESAELLGFGDLPNINEVFNSMRNTIDGLRKTADKSR